MTTSAAFRPAVIDHDPADDAGVVGAGADGPPDRQPVAIREKVPRLVRLPARTMNAPPPAAQMTMPTRLPINRDVAYKVAILSALLLLTGCGAEVAGGAVAVGAMQAKQARQAQAQQAQVVEALKAAQDAGAARAASAAD